MKWLVIASGARQSSCTAVLGCFAPLAMTKQREVDAPEFANGAFGMTTVTLISRRRITLPADICAEVRLVPGGKVDISVNDAGEIIVRPRANAPQTGADRAR